MLTEQELGAFKELIAACGICAKTIEHIDGTYGRLNLLTARHLAIRAAKLGRRTILCEGCDGEEYGACIAADGSRCLGVCECDALTEESGLSMCDHCATVKRERRAEATAQDLKDAGLR